MTPQSEIDKLTIISSTGNIAGEMKNLTAMVDASSDIINRTILFKKFMECSLATGGYVQLLPQLSYLPVLIGNDDHPVYLYQLVEMLEGHLDIDAIQEEFPTLSFSQIIGALSFLRKIAQLNSRQIDVDELEEQFDVEFINNLRQAFEERGNVARVLIDAD